MTNEEKVTLLIKYFGNKNENINLRGIDFGDMIVDNSEQKARVIYNENQEAKAISNVQQKSDEIYNSSQKSKKIFNNSQKSDGIYNWYQQAEEIDNLGQTITSKYDHMSKEQLIEELKKRDKDEN